MAWQRYLIGASCVLFRCAFAVPGKPQQSTVEISGGGTISSEAHPHHERHLRTEHSDDMLGEPLLLEREGSAVPDGYCDGKISIDFQCKETVGKTGTAAFIKGDANCTVECIGSQKGRTAVPATVKCMCPKSNAVCSFKTTGLTCESALAGASCFPRSAQVLQPSGIEASVASLQAGDKVMGLGPEREGGLLTSDAYMGDTHDSYMDARDGSLHPFLEIKHECGGIRTLRVTAEHLVFVVDPSSSRRLKPAGSLKPGVDSILALGCKASQLSPSMVVSVQEVFAEGLYNPMTKSGTAIVDGVATSNCALATGGMLSMKGWQDSPTMRRHAERIAQAVLLPPRILYELGVPWAWLHTKQVHAVYISLIDSLFSLGAIGHALFAWAGQ